MKTSLTCDSKLHADVLQTAQSFLASYKTSLRSSNEEEELTGKMQLEVGRRALNLGCESRNSMERVQSKGCGDNRITSPSKERILIIFCLKEVIPNPGSQSISTRVSF